MLFPCTLHQLKRMKAATLVFVGEFWSYKDARVFYESVTIGPKIHEIVCCAPKDDMTAMLPLRKMDPPEGCIPLALCSY